MVRNLLTRNQRSSTKKQSNRKNQNIDIIDTIDTIGYSNWCNLLRNARSSKLSTLSSQVEFKLVNFSFKLSLSLYSMRILCYSMDKSSNGWQFASPIEMNVMSEQSVIFFYQKMKYLGNLTTWSKNCFTLLISQDAIQTLLKWLKSFLVTDRITEIIKRFIFDDCA